MPTGVAPPTQILLHDDFSDNSQLNPETWHINQYTPVNNPSYYGRTQIAQSLPVVVDGALQLTVQTYNPTGPGNSFLGSEIISSQTFNINAGGIEFTAVAKIVSPVPGLVGGIFGYNYNISTGMDNELDFESLSNDANGSNSQEQTNVYSNQPLGAGNPSFVADPGLATYQTYTMEWFPNEVLWFIDGQLVRQSTSDVPQGPMAFHLNFWVPDTTWADAYSTSLQPTANPSDNTTYSFDVQSLSVSRIGNISDDIQGDGLSDLLIENAAGAVVVGALGGGGQATYAQVAALGSEWTFAGVGDFLGAGDDQFLIENTAGAVVAGKVTSGQAQYTQIGALGPEWKFVETGDFLGVAGDQFLIENTAGAVVIGQVVNGQAQYTQVAALGSAWTFVGCGDFIGDGLSQFLIENTAGAVVVGEVVNGQAQYTQVAALGPEWTVKESGDFLGDGKSDFLIENTAGAVVVGEVVNGQAQYSQVGGLGPEWSFVGAGSYGGTGADGFLIENASGAVFLGTIVSGHAQYAQITALGSEWKFHG